MKILLYLFAIVTVGNSGFLNGGGNDVGGHNDGSSVGNGDYDDVGPLIAALYGNGDHIGGGDESNADLIPIIASLVSNDGNIDSSGSNGGLSMETLQTIVALFGHYGSNLDFGSGQSAYSPDAGTAGNGNGITTLLGILNSIVVR